MQRWRMILVAIAAIGAGRALAQDSKAWLESQGLEAGESKEYQEYEVVVAHPKGTPAEQRVVIFKQGKPAWESGPKDSEPGARWTVHSIGRDLDGDGSPDLHLSTFTGGANCCTTHYIFRLKPQVKRLAVYPAGVMGGGEFIDVPGRKAPIMISADDSSASAFAPYANSYFPMMVLEVGPHGRMQLAHDLMLSRLPGQPPPVCALPVATANLWLKERCGEFGTLRRQARTQDIKAKLQAIKSGRAVEKLEWQDYYANGVLAAVSAEMNRYTYTGHGNAGYNWLETVWPGNDAIKLKLVSTLRQTQAKSAFAEDLKRLALDNH